MPLPGIDQHPAVEWLLNMRRTSSTAFALTFFGKAVWDDRRGVLGKACAFGSIPLVFGICTTIRHAASPRGDLKEPVGGRDVCVR
jgi:hypothetical protein